MTIEDQYRYNVKTEFEFDLGVTNLDVGVIENTLKSTFKQRNMEIKGTVITCKPKQECKHYEEGFGGKIHYLNYSGTYYGTKSTEFQCSKCGKRVALDWSSSSSSSS